MIHALPGMGANRRMYPPPWASLPDFIAQDWTPYAGEKSLADIAESMTETLSIRDGDSLVGSSLGGMVACEITKIRKIKTLYLFGSATGKEEINIVLSMLHPLVQIAPIDWLRFSAGKIPGELSQMFAEAETPFLRSMCSAIFEWQGLTDSATKIFRIHGRKDLVIPPPDKVDLMLNGGHLISVTHAKECVEFIKTNTQSN
jgi:pimeloyl-ACP methyl ester carboxylesterase